MADGAPQIPVTVLTGYLGSGKTTLLNRIPSETHGKRFAVIVNEFAEVGIDNDLIVNVDEEIFEMNNGCICCTVRGDLIRIIAGLMRRSRGFDGIVVEKIVSATRLALRMSPRKHIVVPAKELPPGARTLITISGRPIATSL